MTNIQETEEQISKYWKDNKTFEASLEKTSSGKPYIFYDGPPFATGLPHYGHLLVSVIKDVYPRFFTMKGRYVKRTWGWDCHGLPIESIAEKNLGIKSKDEIEKMGIKKFNDHCRSQVLTFDSEWRTYIEKIGRWVSWSDGYKTMDNSYIESVWWAFKSLYDKGYLYEGEKILMYCPRCATPLAKSEIAMDNSYKTIKELTVTVKFRLKSPCNLIPNTCKPEDKVFAIAWTTTPWTLPSNLALTVNPNLTYAFVKDKSDDNTYLLAKDLIKNFYKSESEYTISKEVKGKELENLEYEPLFPYFKDNPNSFKIILADFVTATEGTGIVHTAPAFGEEDNAICRKYKIPSVQPVDDTGHFTSEVKDYEGKLVYDASEQIVIDLKTSKKAIQSKKMEHEYPFCYRCNTKLMYRALPAWFVDIQKIKERFKELNLNINWFPSHLKEGQMQHNISTAPDWNVTRNRYWATAIPIWKSASGKIKVLGSINELKEHATNLPKEEIDLHKDFLDPIKLKIDGEEYTRIPEVLDCWFESGAMTFAQFHYPFENREFFEKNFPAQFVVEYIGQTRAWFYYMMALSTILFDKMPFENVLTTGIILSEDGKKMSKSLNNYPDPLEMINKYGADTFRFYMLSSPLMTAENLSFSQKGLEEVYKKVTVLLYNVAKYYSEYATEDDSNFEESPNIMDCWIISKTEELNEVLEKSLEKYETIKACAITKKYIEDLSTWYIRNSRNRFNEGDKYTRKTTYYILNKLSKILSPLMPFVTEKIFQDINGKKTSVHLQDYPKSNESLINKTLEEEIENTRKIVSMALQQRDKEQIGIKWPLSKATISTPIQPNEELSLIIKEELNIKEIEYKKSENLEVKLDTKQTKELEDEGYSREISRIIQATRKENGLVKSEQIELEITSEFNESLKSQLESIKTKVGAKDISLEKSNKKFDYSKVGKIKDKEFNIRFNKL
jgi:isoleucyl-tRNA synthetase